MGLWEGNMWVYRYGEISHIPTVSETSSCYTLVKLSTEGEPVVSRVSVIWVCLTTEEGERQKNDR